MHHCRALWISPLRGFPAFLPTIGFSSIGGIGTFAFFAPFSHPFYFPSLRDHDPSSLPFPYGLQQHHKRAPRSAHLSLAFLAILPELQSNRCLDFTILFVGILRWALCRGLSGDRAKNGAFCIFWKKSPQAHSRCLL